MKNIFKQVKFISLTLIFALLVCSPASAGKPAQPPVPAGSALVFVLCYHTFDGIDKYLTDISTSVLKLQLEILGKKGYKFVKFSDILANRVTGSRNVLITIDDGKLSVLRTYNEIFKPLGIKPMLAIYTAVTGKKKYALTWDQIRYLAGEGCEIAAHGYYHNRMTQKEYERDKRAFLDEIYKPKEMLEKELKLPVTVFIYPYGQRSPAAIENLQKAGYKYAFTIAGGGVKVPFDGNTKVYELPRYMLTNKNWDGVFYAMFRKSAGGK
jgi:peptidoglycan/xylan/chitin deacetylase (PgdA/CDA1 family)